MTSSPETRRAQEPWDGYEAAADGLAEYWYPVLPSRLLGRRFRSVRLLGNDVVLIRDGGRIFALEDRCPHRHVKLSRGRKEFPGTVSCAYHGWTFDLATGELTAALTDGPASPVVGTACVRTYPVEERCGLIWLWTGDGEPVPVEDDIPDELLAEDARVIPLLRFADGDWRHACENGFDEAHGKVLHRTSWWVLFKRMAGWNVTEIIRGDDRVWLTRNQREVHDDDHYPGLGRWPRLNLFQRRRARTAQGANAPVVSIRLPGILRVRQPGRANWSHYEWYVPLERDRYRYLVLAVTWASGLRRLTWPLRYWTYILWFHHYNLGNQNLEVVSHMKGSHPAPAFRPDVSIMAWRDMVACEARAPGSPRAQSSARSSARSSQAAE